MVKKDDVSCTLVLSNNIPLPEQSLSKDPHNMYVLMEPGTTYQVEMFNYGTSRKTVAVWVDGEKVFSNTYWLEPNSALTIAGWPRTAKWPEVLTNVAPFVTGTVTAAGTGSSTAASGNHGKVSVAVYEVVPLETVTTQRCTVGALASAASTAPAADTKAAMLQSQATLRPDIKPQAHEEVAAWGIAPTPPLLFDFKYRDALGMQLEKGLTPPAPILPTSTLHPGKAATGGVKRERGTETAVFAVAGDGVVELLDSDDEAPPAAAAAAASVSPPQPKRKRADGPTAMLDLTDEAGGVKESTAVIQTLYWEPTPGSLRKLPSVTVQVPGPGGPTPEEVMAKVLVEATRGYTQDLHGEVQPPPAPYGIILESCLGREAIREWGDVQRTGSDKHGIVVVPSPPR